VKRGLKLTAKAGEGMEKSVEFLGGRLREGESAKKKVWAR
jgi:hypothetical protein